MLAINNYSMNPKANISKIHKNSNSSSVAQIDHKLSLKTSVTTIRSGKSGTSPSVSTNVPYSSTSAANFLDAKSNLFPLKYNFPISSQKFIDSS
jgi:hypothetical protein